MTQLNQNILAENIMLRILSNSGNQSTYLPTAKTLPKVNNNANLMGLANTISDCKRNKKLQYNVIKIYQYYNFKELALQLQLGYNVPQDEAIKYIRGLLYNYNLIQLALFVEVRRKLEIIYFSLVLLANKSGIKFCNYVAFLATLKTGPVSLFGLNRS